MSRVPTAPFPKRPADVPITQKMLLSIRDEILARTRAEMTELRNEFRAEAGGLRNELRTEVGGLRSEISELRAEVRADIARIAVLVEEQNARNAIVLEGLSGLFHRQDRVEKRQDEVEASLIRLAKTRTGKASKA